ncbi:alpha-hydroxy acid oxidase [Frigidibacter oleivorans]|uniref:alpha-hydroxy acid oxidase n=1 Tax=Frigidibacter oleivorans TaxID=2487129 RepID=UPI000F8D0492|nr:alpha-hydroxy acid oxidase [Frigidibacter oleivorans]
MTTTRSTTEPPADIPAAPVAVARREDAIVTRNPSQVPARLRRYLALQDFETRALKRLPASIAGYVAGGVETDQSLQANRAAFRRHVFLPRTLRDVSGRSQSRQLFGQTLQVPFGIAPMGFSALAAFDGDVALAQGAARCGSVAICSAASLTPLERVAAEGGSTWFQAYVPGDNRRIEALLHRLRAAGFDTLVITADAPVAANREHNARNGFDAPFRITPQLVWQGVTHPRWTLGTLGRELFRRGMPHFENMEAVQGPPLFSRTLQRSTIGRERLAWDQVRLARRLWPGRLVVKGLLAPQDAAIAADCGCDGIIVSNHGGRQLDGAIAPLDALPAILRVKAGMTVMMDGGIRRGTDVLKALALGADFVFLGRPFLYAAVMEGAEGVAHAMSLLRDEVDRGLAFLGLGSLDDLSAEHIHAA